MGAEDEGRYSIARVRLSLMDQPPLCALACPGRGLPDYEPCSPTCANWLTNEAPASRLLVRAWFVAVSDERARRDSNPQPFDP